MINLTDLDLRYADHATRVARVGREGWLRETSVPTGGSRPRRAASVVGLMRRQVGGALVGIGGRLQGTPAGHVTDSVTA